MRDQTEDNTQQGKSFLSNLPLLINLISVASIVIEEQIHLIKPYLGEGGFVVVTITVAIINLYFRMYSNNPFVPKQKANTQSSAVRYTRNKRTVEANKESKKEEDEFTLDD